MTDTSENIVSRLRAGITYSLGGEGWSVLDDAADKIDRLTTVNADLLAVAKAAADYLGWQDGTIPEAERASGAAHRTHLLQLLKATCPELLHRAEGKDAP